MGKDILWNLWAKKTFKLYYQTALTQEEPEANILSLTVPVKWLG